MNAIQLLIQRVERLEEKEVYLQKDSEGNMPVHCSILKEKNFLAERLLKSAQKLGIGVDKLVSSDGETPSELKERLIEEKDYLKKMESEE